MTAISQTPLMNIEQTTEVIPSSLSIDEQIDQAIAKIKEKKNTLEQSTQIIDTDISMLDASIQKLQEAKEQHDNEKKVILEQTRKKLPTILGEDGIAGNMEVEYSKLSRKELLATIEKDERLQAIITTLSEDQKEDFIRYVEGWDEKRFQRLSTMLESLENQKISIEQAKEFLGRVMTYFLINTFTPLNKKEVFFSEKGVVLLQDALSVAQESGRFGTSLLASLLTIMVKNHSCTLDSKDGKYILNPPFEVGEKHENYAAFSKEISAILNHPQNKSFLDRNLPTAILKTTSSIDTYAKMEGVTTQEYYNKLIDKAFVGKTEQRKLFDTTNNLQQKINILTTNVADAGDRMFLIHYLKNVTDFPTGENDILESYRTDIENIGMNVQELEKYDIDIEDWGRDPVDSLVKFMGQNKGATAGVIIGGIFTSLFFGKKHKIAGQLAKIAIFAPLVAVVGSKLPFDFNPNLFGLDTASIAKEFGVEIPGKKELFAESIKNENSTLSLNIQTSLDEYALGMNLLPEEKGLVLNALKDLAHIAPHDMKNLKIIDLNVGAIEKLDSVGTDDGITGPQLVEQYHFGDPSPLEHALDLIAILSAHESFKASTMYGVFDGLSKKTREENQETSPRSESIPTENQETPEVQRSLFEQYLEALQNAPTGWKNLSNGGKADFKERFTSNTTLKDFFEGYDENQFYIEALNSLAPENGVVFPLATSEFEKVLEKNNNKKISEFLREGANPVTE